MLGINDCDHGINFHNFFLSDPVALNAWATGKGVEIPVASMKR